MIRLSDYVIDFITKQKVKYVFMVAGGGGMYLIDSLGRNKNIEHVCNHHEQACVMSAEGYQRVTGNLGVALVTTGPAGTNTITSVLCAWNDSIPVLILSGQANSKFLIGETGLRQRAVHEADITRIVETVTKYAVTVKDEKMIRYYLEKAVYLAKNGRPGPVWIDIPLDIQSKMIDEDSLVSFDPQKEIKSLSISTEKANIKKTAVFLKNAKRPIILAGHGIRLSGIQKEFIDFIEKYNIPVATTKNAFDLIYDSHPLLAGRAGINGQRAGNFAVQNSDLVLCLGTRLPFPVIGYETKLFAREAKKIVVDIDDKQLKHALVDIDIKINANLKDFLPVLDKELKGRKPDTKDWILKCRHWRKKYPNVEKSWKEQKKYVNSYYFFETLSDVLRNDDVVVTDQGASFYSSTQAFKLKRDQRLFTNGGFSPMGYGLPAAIGACFGRDKKRVICVHGEGGLELNIQELQTIIHYQLPVKLFVFNNQGYLSIKHTQVAFFGGFLVGADPKSGLSCADAVKVGKAYGFKTMSIKNHKNLKQKIKKSISTRGPILIEVILDPMQLFLPKVTSERKPDGRLVSKPLEDMYPFLDRNEFKKEMIIKPIEE